jgi:cytochrome P450
MLPLARSGDPWHVGRKLLDRGLRPGAVVGYRPLQQARAHVLLTRLLESPHKWEAHVELSVSTVELIRYAAELF